MDGKLYAARYLGNGFVPCVPARDLAVGEVSYYVGMGLLSLDAWCFEFVEVESEGENEDDDC